MIIEAIGLFFACMLAATIIPFSSEALLIASAYQTGLDIWPSFAFALAGNVCGTLINYAAGRWGGEWITKKLGISPEKLETWHKRHEKYERWLWAANWLPFIGDPITIYAGVVKLRISEFLLWVIPLRAARYIVVIFFWEGVVQ